MSGRSDTRSRPQPAMTSSPEVRRLKRELQRVTEERDILRPRTSPRCKVKYAFIAEHRPISIRAMCAASRCSQRLLRAEGPAQTRQVGRRQIELIRTAWRDSSKVYVPRRLWTWARTAVRTGRTTGAARRHPGADWEQAPPRHVRRQPSRSSQHARPPVRRGGAGQGLVTDITIHRNPRGLRLSSGRARPLLAPHVRMVDAAADDQRLLQALLAAVGGASECACWCIRIRQPVHEGVGILLKQRSGALDDRRGNARQRGGTSSTAQARADPSQGLPDAR